MILPRRLRRAAAVSRARELSIAGTPRVAAGRQAIDEVHRGLLGPDGALWPDGWPGVFPSGKGGREALFAAGVAPEEARTHLARHPRPLYCEADDDCGRRVAALFLTKGPPPLEEVLCVGTCRGHAREAVRRLKMAGVAHYRVR